LGGPGINLTNGPNGPGYQGGHAAIWANGLSSQTTANTDMKKIFLIILCFMAIYSAKCSHIVGGELFYDCTGNNVYSVTLKLYRDCNCQNCAQYGNPEYVSIFDGAGNLYTQLALPLPPVDTLQATYSSSCQQPSTSCIEEADYNGTVMLPGNATGYTIVYQRCCRTNAVLNLATGQGATFTCEVPPGSLASCNNSARFNGLPPLNICLNSPLSIDCSATDPDGDSLVYSLCDPYSGASATCPDPSPNGTAGTGCSTVPTPPPYTSALYLSPYSAANFTNSPSTASDLAIDPVYGLLTGTPNNIGIYDITICVSEYRNGQLLNVLRRDFMITVAQCDIPIASVPIVSINHGVGVYTIDCKSLTVNFINTSTNPNQTPLSYAWNFGVPGSTTDTSSLSSPSFTYADTGTYLAQLVVGAANPTGSGMCTDTTTAYVYLYPTLNTAFTAPSRCLDSTIAFVDQSTSTSGQINSWIWNFGDGTGSNQQNPTHNYTAAGTFPVTLISDNARGCKDTATKLITVYPKPAASFTADTVLCATAADVFTNTSTGNVASYYWNFGPGGTSTLASPTHVYNSAGNYTATLIDISPNGCKDTTSDNIVVNPLPVVTTSGNVAICPFASTQLSASGGVTYLWTPATGLSDSAISNPVAAPPPPNTTTYIVTVTSAQNCSSTSGLTVSFFPVPHANAGIDTSVCLNPSIFHDSVLLNPSGGVSYQWSPATGLSNPNIANPLAKPTANTTYTVTATDVNGCTASDSMTVFVLNPALRLIVQDTVSICQRDTAYATILNQGSSGYVWTPSNYLTDDTSWNTGFYPQVTTTFTLEVTNWCYIKSQSIVIVVFPIPQLGLPAVDSVCIGSSYQFNAQDALTYQWNPDPTLSSTTIANPVATPTVTTKYIVTGINQNGCVNKDSTLLFVYEPSTILVFPADTPFICQGTPAPLRAIGAYSYVWTPASTLSNANTANPTATPTVTTQYNVVATNIHGCKTDDSLVITVQMPVTASTQSPFVACEGIPVHLFASGGPFYSWSPSAGLNDTTTNDPFALPDSTTSYTVKVFNDCFSSTAVAVVEIHPLPVVDAGPDTTIWRDTYAELHGTANTDTFFWNPSIGVENAASLNTNAYPQQTSWYYLFAIDQYGCQNKDSVLITVISHTELLIPTAFSPNGDGVNDVFKIVRTLNIASLTEFAVFDRWGEKVFSTDNIDQGWDGTRNGQPSPLGVYAWIVIAQTKDGQEVTKKGNVTLIR
jgi:gliding motility-associated-like protein